MPTSLNIRDLFRLVSVPRIGPQKVRALLSRFKDPAAVLGAPARELIRVPGIDRKLASHIAHHDGEAFADEQLKRLNRHGARVVTYWDPDYPDLLRSIYDPPVLLYVRGTLLDGDQSSLAIVGTRHPTLYGQKAAEQFSRDLTALQITVVSGLARGIDTVAHASTLKAGGRTIAVIGSGLDVPYPPENRRLMELIAEEGAVVSEFPMGAKPDAPNFPRRNRIISGMSLGTIVIESGEDGGAMITASTALDQNREVFAVPGGIFDKKSAGPNTLIKQGQAKLVLTVADVLEELGTRISLSGRVPPLPPPEPPLTLFERKVVDQLSSEPLHIDVIADRAETTTADALVTLLTLEFKGVVRQLPGKHFVRT